MAKKFELFFLSKNLELLPYIIVHCVQLILMCHFTVQFARPGENRRMLVDEIIFERWREFIKHYVRTVYTTLYSMIISIDQQHKAVWELLVADESSQKSTEKTQYRKFETNIPRKGTVRPQSQFLHLCFCERFIYSHHRSVYSAAGKYVDRSWENINRSQTHECVTWDWGSAIPFLGKHKGDFRCSAKNQSNVYQSYDDEIICTKTTEKFRLFF